MKLISAEEKTLQVKAIADKYDWNKIAERRGEILPVDALKKTKGIAEKVKNRQQSRIKRLKADYTD